MTTTTKNRKHYVSLEGRLFKRVSKTRTYEYVVAVAYDVEAIIAEHSSNAYRQSHARCFHYLKFVANCVPGVPTAYVYPNGTVDSLPIAYTKEKIDAALEEIGPFRDAADYADAMIAKSVANLRDQDAAGKFREFPATWCSRLDLAQKAMSRYSKNVKSVRIVPVSDDAGDPTDLD